jgi:SsrA-binding protein
MAKVKFKKIEIVNRKSEYEYIFIKKYETGIMLSGPEVKSIRMGTANLSDAYCLFRDNELYVKNMHISEYKYSSSEIHDAKRFRKLLLRKKELTYLEKRIAEKGLTIVPYKIYVTDRGMIKLEVVLSQGKKSYDKREAIKEKDNKRELDRIKKIKL